MDTLEYYCTKREIEDLLSCASKIGYIKGLGDVGKISKYISRNRAYKVFTKARIRRWVNEGLLLPKYSGNGKTSTIYYEYLKIVELDMSDEIKIRKPGPCSRREPE
jgi:hypothetical protein